MTAILREAAYPTVRAITWAPVLAVSAALLGLAALLRASEARPGATLVLGAAAMAAAAMFALRDPAGALLAGVPTSPMARRLLRVGLVAAVALPSWLVVTLVLPGDGTALAPALALTATGLAAATWLGASAAVGTAAAVPLLWAGAGETIGRLSWPVGDALSWWRTDPWYVVAVALVLLVVGRHR
jgi:hypothetical protein